MSCGGLAGQEGKGSGGGWGGRGEGRLWELWQRLSGCETTLTRGQRRWPDCQTSFATSAQTPSSLPQPPRPTWNAATPTATDPPSSPLPH